MKVFVSAFIAVLLFVSLVFARVGGGDIPFEAKGTGKAVFSHDGHVGGAGLKCTDCHAHLFTTTEKHKTATMAQMQKGQSCGACHNGKKAFDVKTNCANCHKKS